MSTILDALRKSERDRTLVRGLGFGDAGPPLSRDIGWLPWLIAGVAIVTLTVVATTFVVRGPPGLATPAATAVTSKQAVGAEPSRSAVTAANDTVPNAPPARDLATQAPNTPPSIQTSSESLSLAPAVGEASLLSAMAPEFQQSVPAMTVNIHVYSPDEAQRILYINNRQYYRGNEIPGGVVVEAILPDGVALQFRGQRFKLPRPS